MLTEDEFEEQRNALSAEMVELLRKYHIMAAVAVLSGFTVMAHCAMDSPREEARDILEDLHAHQLAQFDDDESYKQAETCGCSVWAETSAPKPN